MKHIIQNIHIKLSHDDMNTVGFQAVGTIASTKVLSFRAEPTIRGAFKHLYEAAQRVVGRRNVQWPEAKLVHEQRRWFTQEQAHKANMARMLERFRAGGLAEVMRRQPQ